jgi:3-carboxy-cis,cis-muconate cycloisomerase
VQALIAGRLHLSDADVPSRSAFDAQAAYASVLALMAATIEKIAGEVIFMQRTEIGEASESFHRGKVGSSTMAQKRNPAQAQNLVGLARLLRGRMPLLLEAMVRANEGDASACNVADVTLPEVVVCAVSLAEGLAQLVEGLAVNADAMRANLGLTKGLIVSEAVMMTLARHIGRHNAHKVLYDVAHDATDSGEGFAALLMRHPLLEDALPHIDLAQLLKPENYLGEAAALVDAELARA